MNLSPLACSCVCVEVDKTNIKTKWSTKFFDKYLPQSIDSFIILTRNIQDRYTQEKKVYRRIVDKFYGGIYFRVIFDKIMLRIWIQWWEIWLRCWIFIRINIRWLNKVSFWDERMELNNLMSLVLVSTKFMELFLTDDVYACILMINTFDDVVRKSR